MKRRKLKGGARAWTRRIDPPFHRFIRLRDTNEDGYGTCCTCNKSIHFHEGDAGHFQPRQHKATRWNEENVNLQCKYCNMYEGGAQYAYSKFLGEDKADELVALSRTIYKLSDAEFEDIYYHYKEKVAEMEKTKTFLVS
jgi:hypothetical protein